MASAEAERLRAQLEKAGARVVKAFILEVDANLRASPRRGGTPRKTGHAAASWRSSVGQPSGGEPFGRDASYHASGVAEIVRYRLVDGAAYESNNAPYVPLLNLGHSKQAPPGFIEAAIQRAEVAIEQRFGVSIDLDSSAFASAAGGAAAENLAGTYSPFGDEP